MARGTPLDGHFAQNKNIVLVRNETLDNLELAKLEEGLDSRRTGLQLSCGQLFNKKKHRKKKLQSRIRKKACVRLLVRFVTTHSYPLESGL